MPEASIQLASMNNGYHISYEDSGLNIQQTSSSSNWAHTIQGSQGLKAACIFQGEENRIIFRLPSDFVAMAIFLAAMNIDTEIQFVVEPFLAHTLRNNPVHEQTELFLYLSNGFLRIHQFL